MASAKCHPCTSTTCEEEPTAAQAASQGRVVSACTEYGEPSGLSPQQAFESTLKAKDMYALDTTTVRPYDRDKLRVLREGVTPLPLRPRLPQDAAESLDRL